MLRTSDVLTSTPTASLIATDFVASMLKTTTESLDYGNIKALVMARFSKRAAMDSKAASYQLTEADNLSASLQVALDEGVLARLGELRALPADWDSYGAVPLSSNTLRRAELLISDLEEQTKALSPVEISPNPDGGVELEWSSTDRMLDLIVEPDGDLRYLLRIGDGDDVFYDSGLVSSQWKLNSLLSSLR